MNTPYSERVPKQITRNYNNVGRFSVNFRIAIVVNSRTLNCSAPQIIVLFSTPRFRDDNNTYYKCPVVLLRSILRRETRLSRPITIFRRRRVSYGTLFPPRLIK